MSSRPSEKQRLKANSERPAHWAVVLGLLLLLLATVAAAQPANQAAVVVRFSDERVESYCVSFAEEEISGYALLERTGLAFEAQEVGMGASVCQVDDVGCGSNNCFCQCRGATCEYWSYWQMRDGAWQYASGGASINRVRHGDIQGWSWGPGSVSQAIAPPAATFEDICVDGGSSGPADNGESATLSAEGQVVVLPTATVERPPEPDSSASEGGLGAEAGSPLASYGAFGLLLLVLGALALVVARRRTADAESDEA